MVRKIIFVSLFVMSSAISAAPWYHQFYGYYSAGVPVELKRGLSDDSFEISEKQLLSTLSEGAHITSYSTYNEYLYGWYGVGYRFSPQFSMEINRYHLGANAYYKRYNHWKVWTDFDSNKFLDKKEQHFDLIGGFVSAKFYSPTFRLFRATPKTNRLLSIPDAVQTKDDLECYIKEESTRTVGWLHTFNFYLQFGMGYYNGRDSSVWRTGNDYPGDYKEGSLDNKISSRPTLVGGVGGQYYLGQHCSVDGTWLYVIPLESRRTVDPFHLFKIGVNAYL